jgi:DNA-directed RNA polymerase specialized sigma24 family protein
MTNEGEPRAALDQLLATLRPKLHRYCARMPVR